MRSRSRSTREALCSDDTDLAAATLSTPFTTFRVNFVNIEGLVLYFTATGGSSACVTATGGGAMTSAPNFTTAAFTAPPKVFTLDMNPIRKEEAVECRGGGSGANTVDGNTADVTGPAGSLAPDSLATISDLCEDSLDGASSSPATGESIMLCNRWFRLKTGRSWRLRS